MERQGIDHRYSYMLAVGKSAEKRLSILNEIFESSSQNLLLQAGLSKDKKVLEVGCGTGNMTCWIAKQVKAKGEVCAVDISQEQLSIVKNKCKKMEINNVVFEHKSIFELSDYPKKFDIIYSRFVLMHIKNPYEALKILKNLLNPSGVIVCEEASNAIYSCYPCSAAYSQARKLLLKLSRINGLDSKISEKLYSYFRQLNMCEIYANFIQPIYKNKKQKLLIPLLFGEAMNKFVQKNLIEEREAENLVKGLFDFAKNEGYFVSFPKTIQIYGKI